MIRNILRPPYRVYKKALGLLLYLGAILLQQPYFGSWLMANQCHPSRQRVMNRLIRQRLAGRAEFNVLEIGAWAGVSTVIWAKALKDAGVKGKVVVVDHWRTTPAAPLEMRLATCMNTIFKLFLHNIRSAGLDEYVTIVRAPSDEGLRLLSGQAFDFIYIDGDHAYSQVRRDIENCKPLLKGDALICGDDLELQAHEVKLAHATRNKERDWIEEPRSGTWYHPGVTLAVAETLGAVHSDQGFWYT